MPILNLIVNTKHISFKEGEAMKIKKFFVITFIFSIIFLFSISTNILAKDTQSSEVHILDTGQSDCILIKGSENILIDTGAVGLGSHIINYLKQNNVKNIDYIIITHYHDDHYGSLIDICDRIEVKNVLLPMHKNKNRDILYKELFNKNTKVKFIYRNWELSNEEIKLKAILPIRVDEKIENNNSIVLQGTIEGINYMFMGDAEKEEERTLKEAEIKPCDILKIGHHGLNTSTSRYLLKLLKPKIALITCDGKESPDNSVIKNLERLNCKIYRTDKQGAIIIKGRDYKNIEIKTENMLE